MKCKICGATIDENSNLCHRCRERVEYLSSEMLNNKKKINLKFTKHHYLEEIG